MFVQNEIAKEKIHKILEYWYTIEFLDQDNFPNGRNYLEKIRNHRRDLKQGKLVNTKQLMVFADITNTEIMQNVHNEVKECEMNCWGNITVYIGKIKRELCIRTLISKLGIKEDKRPETSVDRIALASFQVTPVGKYVDNSLSLSPVLWAVKQIDSKNDDVAKKINQDLYDGDVSTLEHILTPKEDDNERYRILLDDINRLYTTIYEKYIKDSIIRENGELAVEKNFVIMYQAFANEKAKDRYEDDTYTGLSRNYFSEDIRMIINQNSYGELSEAMQDYILALHKKYASSEYTHRIDVVHSNNLEEYELQLNHIMRMKNAPIGKWPSKYMPALMQQMAIDLLVGKDSRQMFGKNGKVFSVNGPPGTGKTTLLKEIVVNNIVERAILLAEYDYPDDAFHKENFKNGKKSKHAYSNYVRHWYKLKNDQINDYSILVTSCNNAAVENISKELPVGKGILDDLSVDDDAPQIIREQLDEVRQLFDVSMSKDMETFFAWDSERVDLFPDIYFTEYANELLDIDNAWGLIAAPLGKKSNKKNFYYKVLNNLLRDFYQKNENVEARLSLYHEVRRAFIEQCDVVKKMQQNLDFYGEISEKRIIRTREKEEIIEKNRNLILNEDDKISELSHKLAEIGENIKLNYCRFKEVAFKKNKLEVEVQKKETQILSLTEQLLEAREKVLSVQNSIGLFARLFKTQKYKDAMKLAELHRINGNNIESRILTNQEQLLLFKEKVTILCEEYEEIENQIEQLNSKEKLYRRQIADSTKEIEKLNNKIKKMQDEIDVIQKKYADAIYDFDKEKSGIALDEKYIQKIFSNDKKESTQAQVNNPWTTQMYNREREKLFYYAIKLNKEFILSSKACRDNFKSIGHYWGYLTGDDNEVIEFCESSESGCVMALIQTLFLLVPVISSTFASVNSFFKGVSQSGAVGLLVVDEAGQAQPQMALGALYRSRKAMIVGDPKQVEPVVTDELKLLKETYHEEIYNPYKEKNISVQICADLMNPFGTFMDNGSDNPDWVGCPLLVHRRCISPMYEISNSLSYNGMMKQQTREPKPEISEKFIYDKSQWINVVGKEQGIKKHFVKLQGDKVCEMLEVAFARDENPDVYIISPFTTVVNGMREHIQAYCKLNKSSPIQNALQEWIYNNIGTVHTFQGKEAKEVIFLLGCDESKESSGAINWVNKNIVNVAVTRAKFRLYVIGDEKAWSNSDCVELVYKIMNK